MGNNQSRGLKIKYANVIAGVVFVLLAAGIFIICKTDNLDFYANRSPGPGFMPMISAVLIGICGVGIAIKAILNLRGKLVDTEGDKVIATWIEWKSFFIIIGIGTATVILTEYLGLIIAVTAAMVLLIRFLGPESWKTSLLVGIGTGIVIYLIFIVLLKVYVPKGPFGF